MSQETPAISTVVVNTESGNIEAVNPLPDIVSTVPEDKEPENT